MAACQLLVRLALELNPEWQPEYEKYNNIPGARVCHGEHAAFDGKKSRRRASQRGVNLGQVAINPIFVVPTSASERFSKAQWGGLQAQSKRVHENSRPDP